MKTERIARLGAVAAVLIASTPCAASGLAARVTLEPGAALLRAGGKSNLGGLGGVVAAVRLVDLLWVEAWADQRRFPDGAPVSEVTTYGALVGYDIDVGAITPFAELGMARPRLTLAPTPRLPKGAQTSEIVPVLGLGFDIALSGFAQLGAVVRYLPLFETALLSAPAFTAVSARLSLCLGCDAW